MVVNSKHQDVLPPTACVLDFPFAEIGVVQVATRKDHHDVAPLDLRAQPALPVLARVDPLIAMGVPRIGAEAPEFVRKEAAELAVPGSRMTEKNGDATAGRLISGHANILATRSATNRKSDPLP